MKALVLSHISDMSGGAERSMLDVFDYWAKHYGMKPEFVMRLPVKSLAGELKKRGWKYHALDYTFWSDGNPPQREEDIYRNWRRNQKAVSDLEKLIKKVRPDVVMTNSVVCPWMALAAYRTGVPHVWFVREYGDLDHGRTFEIGRAKTWQDVGNLSSLVITISEALGKHLSQYMDKGKVAILYNPFDIPEYDKRASLKVPSPYKYKDSLKVIMLANLAAGKGQVEAVEAVGQLNKQGHNVEIAIRSNGEQYLKEDINKLINKYDLKDKVHFSDFSPEWLAYPKHADVAIMSSRMEGFGRVTFEYIALGLPVIGANSGATPEMVKDGVNGYLFNAGDTVSLAKALDHYADKPELIATHGLASRKRAEAMMSGLYNIDEAYKRVVAAIDNYKPENHIINMFEHWTDYEKRFKSMPKDVCESLRLRLRHRARRYAKAAYVRARTAKAKVTGK